MIERKEKLTNGKTVIFLVPENDKDVKKIMELEKKGECSDKNSFGDWKGGHKGAT